MIALDTSVLVRYLVEDDRAQSARASALVESAIARDERLFVSQIVLCEVAWVMTSGYGFSRGEVAGVLRRLLKARQVIVEEIDRVRASLEAFASGRADFADYLILEASRSAGCERLATFDADLLSQPDAIEP